MRKKKQLKKSQVIILICTIAITAFSLSYYFYRKYSQSDTFSKSNKYHIQGVDVSHHNPILNWSEVKSQNIHFAYIKATEGITHDDRNYIYNYKQAKENSVKIGAYHFYSFGVSGRDQAKHFIRIAKCETGDLIPAIDVEHSPSNPYTKDTAFIAMVIKELIILEEELYEHYGMRPIIYTNRDCYNLYIKKNFPENRIWISSLDEEPKDEEIKNWIIWQFTHKGELPGIVGNVDFNYFRYSYDRLDEISLP